MEERWISKTDRKKQQTISNYCKYEAEKMNLLKCWNERKPYLIQKLAQNMSNNPFCIDFLTSTLYILCTQFIIIIKIYETCGLLYIILFTWLGLANQKIKTVRDFSIWKIVFACVSNSYNQINSFFVYFNSFFCLF